MPFCLDKPLLAKSATVEALCFIKNVIAKTSVPSWVESVPHNFGDCSAGTLKADEWWTLSTIYLPLTLIALWGINVTTTTWALHLCRVLGHTMLPVSAITITCKCTTSQLCSQMYLQCMVPYISQLVDIHSHATVEPYHHMSMHLPHFFSLFGPTRTLWTYPFEWLIGQIQQLLSNHKLGKLS